MQDESTCQTTSAKKWHRGGMAKSIKVEWKTIKEHISSNFGCSLRQMSGATHGPLGSSRAMLSIGGITGDGSGGSGVLLVLVDSPVKDIVVLEALANKEITEDLSEVRIVWLVVEAKGTGVVEIDGKLVGKVAAKDLGGSGHLLLHDAIVLLLLGGRLEALPWEGATDEVKQNISKRLHIVTT